MICIFDDDYSFYSTVVTIGKFDALHMGHRALVERMEPFRKHGFKTVVLRLKMKSSFPPLRSEEERIGLLEKMGVDIYICHEFTGKDAHMSAEDFVKDVLVGRLGAKAVVVGEDFRFGFERRGDAKLLEAEGLKYGFDTVVLPKVTYKGQEVSSSRIREAIREGRNEEAAAMLA